MASDPGIEIRKILHQLDNEIDKASKLTANGVDRVNLAAQKRRVNRAKACIEEIRAAIFDIPPKGHRSLGSKQVQEVCNILERVYKRKQSCATFVVDMERTKLTELFSGVDIPLEIREEK